MRAPMVGRKGYSGSGALWAGTLAATMFSIFATFILYGINPQTWMIAYLQACAINGAKAPSDLSSFLPWSMDEARLAAMRSHVPIMSMALQSESISTAVPNPELELELDST